MTRQLQGRPGLALMQCQGRNPKCHPRSARAVFELRPNLTSDIPDYRPGIARDAPALHQGRVRDAPE